ncbi:TonB-dependent receptor domain-containing protein [Spirosoma luteum]|uniref:TonB-dependent receptor domain-containing protein n=1 Tax=Spirosoma luteum TaxID=431553 RepID=UPI000368ADF7|nr:outer membrane beta-barrel family protein [Spirosoma luteum]
MKKHFFFLLLTLGLFAQTPALFAQFGPPGGGPGGPPGGGFGRDQRKKEFTGVTEDIPKGNGKIAGILIDSISGKPVEFATVALMNVKTNKPIDGTTSDAKGQFSMNKLAPGDYRLQYSFIGYKNVDSQPFTIVKGTDLNMGAVKLPADIRTLGEVVVTGQAALIEEKVDRLVFNADKDMTSKGGDASDVLKRVPMLSVDLDGNVSLRGSQNIRVLINNKPSTIVASSVADALKQIPADMIKTVEVITSPSAKYDAEGAAGIINIVTKKITLHGLTLNVDAGVGLRASNLGLNGSFRQGKLGISLGGFGRAMYNRASSTLDQTTLVGAQLLRTSQQATAFDKPVFGQYTMGFDYDLAKNQSLTANVRYGTRNFIQQQQQLTSTYTQTSRSIDSLLSMTNRDVNRRDLSNSVDMNLDYIHTFKPQQEWSISTQYSRTGLTNNFYADLLNNMGTLTGRQRNLNNNTNQEMTIQTDYQTPIRKNQLLEFGGKAIMRQVDSHYQYQVGSSTGELRFDPTNPAGSLLYSQNIGAGYMSYTYVTPSKYTFKVGTRYEHTGITATQSTEQRGNIPLVIPAYGNLVPSINVSKSLKGGTTLKAAYNRRIQRPGLQQLNPNPNSANPQMVMVGNPTLKPELTDNAELSLSSTIKKTYINAALFGRLTNNAITQIRLPSDTLAGGIITTYQNIGVQRTVGANIFFNTNLTPKWSLNGGLDGYYVYMQGLTPGADGKSMMISNTGVSIGGRLMSQLQLDKGWSAQVFSFFRGPSPQLQGTQGSFYMYSLGVRKDLASKRGSIGLAAENFAGNGITMRTTLNSPLISQVNVTHLYNANLKVTFTYRIGKMSFEEPRRKARSVSNDDVKGGDGGDGGGQPQAAPAANRPR